MNKLHNPKVFCKAYDFLLEELGAEAAVLYGLIEQFENTKSEFFASREWIAKKLKCSPRTADKLVSSLVDSGYAKKYYKGRNRYLTITAKSAVVSTPTTANSAINHGKNCRRTTAKSADYIDKSYIDKTYIDNYNLSSVIVDNLTSRQNLPRCNQERQDMPEPQFENFWNGLSDQEKRDFARRAGDKLGGLKAKLAAGPDGLAKLLVLQEYWRDDESVIELVEDYKF